LVMMLPVGFVCMAFIMLKLFSSISQVFLIIKGIEFFYIFFLYHLRQIYNFFPLFCSCDVLHWFIFVCLTTFTFQE
jgi:hypothetical protein